MRYLIVYIVSEAVDNTPVPRIEPLVGAPIKNIVVHAGREDPVALPDDQYPEWMWQLVKDASKTIDEDADENVEIRTRNDLRKISKAKIKAANEIGG